MMAELHRIVNEELPKFDGKAVVLTGQPSGGAFCAGSDVNCLVEFSSPQDGLKAQFNMFSLREIYNSILQLQGEVIRYKRGPL